MRLPSFPLFKSRYLIFLAAFLIMILNLLDLAGAMYQKESLKKIMPFYFQGIKFSGLQDELRREDYVGYFSDAKPGSKTFESQLAQAQYILAPVILQEQSSRHRYLLFDQMSEAEAFPKIRAADAVPVKKNQFGVILARKNR